MLSATSYPHGNESMWLVCDLFPSAVMDFYPCLPPHAYHVSPSNRRDSIVNAYPFVWCSSHPEKKVSPGENFGLATGAPGKGIYVVFASSFPPMPAISLGNTQNRLENKFGS